MKFIVTYKKLFASLLVFLWILLILYVVIENLGMIGEDIGLFESLSSSGFARTMFLDIGVMSTIIACWIVVSGKQKFRYFFAIATMFVGSFAFLPYLAIYLLKLSAPNEKT